jgi:hypothetical protein
MLPSCCSLWGLPPVLRVEGWLAEAPGRRESGWVGVAYVSLCLSSHWACLSLLYIFFPPRTGFLMSCTLVLAEMHPGPLEDRTGMQTPNGSAAASKTWARARCL